jgi:glycopeptide antibiotics resistance protein
MICGLLAMSLAGYLAALGGSHPAAKAGAIGIIAVCALESSQLLITSRMPGLWDAAVGTAGVILGALLWASFGPVGSTAPWRVGLVALTAGAAAILMLSPFELAEQYRGFSWYPFRSYYERTTFEGLSHVIELGLAYFPLGYFAERKSRQWRQFTQVLGLALVIAGPIEYLQGWIVGRFSDISDIGLSLAGAALGLMAGDTSSK